MNFDNAPGASTATAAPPGATYRWNVILLLTASQMIAYIDRVNLSVAAPLLIKQYHYTPAELGLLFSLFSLVFTISLIPAGPFVDWVRARVGYIFGVLLWSVGTVLCGTTVAFTPLAVYRAFIGVGEAPMIPAGQRIIYETFPKHQRASAIATFFAGNKIGLALGIPFAAVLLHWLGLSWVFYVTGALGFIWMVWFLATYREKPSAPRLAKDSVRWSALLRYRTTWGIMLGQAGYLYTYYVFATWLPGYLVLQRKMSLLNSGFVGMMPFVVGVFVTIFGGWVSDWLVAQNIRITIVRKTLSVAGLLAASVFTLLGAYTNGAVLAVTFLTLAIAGFSFATGSIQSMAVDVAPPHVVSSLVSLQNFGGNIGGSFAPVITGMLISKVSGFQVPLLITAVVALVLGCGGFGLIVGNLDDTLRPKESAGRPVAHP
ncbi:MAG: MFS transporter [Candidatus Acidiferrales bacterium]